MLLGRTLNRLAFYYNGYALRGGDEWMDAATANTKAGECVDEATKTFEAVSTYIEGENRQNIW